MMLSTTSAIYEGTIRHQRFAPVRHGFRWRTFMLYMDLDELPSLLDRLPLWSGRRPAPGRFRREDYFGDPRVSLADTVRDTVAEACGVRPEGPVRMLGHLRYFGYVFNPVVFYYLFDRHEQHCATVADITNTPWGERHQIVLPAANGPFSRHRFAKPFHVSPFMPLAQEYDWTIGRPGEALTIAMRNLEDGRPLFTALLELRRRPITRGAMAGLLVRYPLQTVQIIARIYAHALWLRLKGVRYLEYPGSTAGRTVVDHSQPPRMHDAA
ncbi:MAG: DUF1365 domain-containing protein [Candidatus Dadabacteria bacterium]|nr:MAG: DUF1365 domain-containing protein [Candidatus Dadabacteria bacterium]